MAEHKHFKTAKAEWKPTEKEKKERERESILNLQMSS